MESLGGGLDDSDEVELIFLRWPRVECPGVGGVEQSDCE